MLSENKWLALSQEGEKVSLQLAKPHPANRLSLSLVLAAFFSFAAGPFHKPQPPPATATIITMRRVDCRR